MYSRAASSLSSRTSMVIIRASALKSTKYTAAATMSTFERGTHNRDDAERTASKMRGEALTGHKHRGHVAIVSLLLGPLQQISEDLLPALGFRQQVEGVDDHGQLPPVLGAVACTLLDQGLEYQLQRIGCSWKQRNASVSQHKTMYPSAIIPWGTSRLAISRVRMNFSSQL